MAKKSVQYSWGIDYVSDDENQSSEGEGTFTEFTKEVKELLSEADVSDVQISIETIKEENDDATTND